MTTASISCARELGNLPNGCQVSIPKWCFQQGDLYGAATGFHHCQQGE
jgi:hypothetical protein